MSLWKLRERRKKLGPGTRKGPRTATLVILFIVVLILIFYLGRVGS
jgi:hypothetical protein